jgi:hypothetical protein
MAEQDMLVVPDGEMANWGLLLKTLATGINHFDGANLKPDAATEQVTGSAPAAGSLLENAVQRVATASAQNPPTHAEFTAAEFTALLGDVGSGIAMPDGVTMVRLIQSGGGHLVIRLPAKEALLKQEYKILNGEEYGPRAFITEWFARRAASPGAAISPAERMLLNDQFVGDYAVTHCM